MRLRILLEPHHGATYAQILALAKAADDGGFDAFFRSDHYLGIDAGDMTYQPTDSWTTLAGLAVQTERVRLGTLVNASTFRLPVPHPLPAGRRQVRQRGARAQGTRPRSPGGLPLPADRARPGRGGRRDAVAVRVPDRGEHCQGPGISVRGTPGELRLPPRPWTGEGVRTPPFGFT